MEAKNKAQEISGKLIITCGDPTKLFELIKKHLTT